MCTIKPTREPSDHEYGDIFIIPAKLITLVTLREQGIAAT
jgi:hypothetical protein